MIKKDDEETKVIFKWATYGGIEEGEPIAFFPGEPANQGCIQCYAHLGQHGEACEEFYRDSCRNCTPEQYVPLKKELENCFGYKLKIVKRITRKDREKAWKRIG